MSIQGSNQMLCEILKAIKCLNVAAPPVVVVPPCQPCMAVGGVVDPNITLAYVDGVATFYGLDGVLDPAVVEVLSPCDPRCGCVCTNGEDCECACTTDDLAGVAQAIGAL